MIAAPKSADGSVQSSYGSVIQILHTDVSLAAQTSQSASPVSNVSEDLVDPSAIATNTKKNDDFPATEVTDTLADKAPTELATAKAKEETEAQITDTLVKEDKAGEPMLMEQYAVGNGPSDELHGVQTDTQQEAAEEDLKKRSAKANKNEDSAEMDRKKETDEVDSEKEELETSAEVLPAMDTLHPKELVLNSLTVNEVKGLLPHMDRAENSANIELLENSSAEPLESLSEPSCEVEKTVLAIEKSLADEVLENNDEQVVSNMSEMKEDSIPLKTQETSEQESFPTVNISKEFTVNYIENGQTDDLTGGDRKDVDVPQSTELLQELCEEASHIENQDLECESPANSKK